MIATTDKLNERAQNILKALERDGEQVEFFRKVHLGKFIISIQASERHYCNPRQTLSSPDEYDEFEMAIFDERDEWVNPRADMQLKDFSWSSKFENFDCPVYGYVGREEACNVLKDLLLVCSKNLN